MKRATIPPAVAPKPTAGQAAKQPRANSSPVGSPKLIRANRATVLRQANAAAKKESRSVSPRLASSPRSLLNESVGSSSLGSPRSLGASSSVGSGSGRSSRFSQRGTPSAVELRAQSPATGAAQEDTKTPGLVRQGTFTKDDLGSNTTIDKTAKPASASGIPRHSPNSAGGGLTVRQATSASLRSSAAGRTPPKVPPKPAAGSLFPRRSDSVQPCPSPKPLVATTKTQALREEQSALLARGHGLRSSNSSTSSRGSSTVSRNSIRTSSSSQSLRNACAAIPAGGASPPERAPSSSDIERRKTSLQQTVVVPRPLSPDFRQPVHHTAEANVHSTVRTLSPLSRRPRSPGAEAASTGKTTVITASAPKKDVTSKIANLWKKVEESKLKQQQNTTKKDGTKDKRVWISKGGKLQQERSDSLRQDTAGPTPGRLIRSGTYEKLNVEQAPGAVMTAMPPPATAKEMKPRSRSRLSIKLSKFGLSKKKGDEDDHTNGNHHHRQTQSPETDDLGNSLHPVLSSPDSGTSPADNIVDYSERLAAAAHSFRSSSSASSSRASLAAAVVAPFNYTPSATVAGLERVKSAAQIKRNSSYVSSMGRKREEGDVSPDENGDRRAGKKSSTGAVGAPIAYTGNTSSSVVTLV